MTQHEPTREKPDDRSDAPQTDRRPDPKQSKPECQPGGQGGDKPPAPPKKRSKLPLIILGIVLVIAAIGGGFYWYSTRNQDSTDDAFTDGTAVTIAPQVAGTVTRLAVTDNQFVHAGDLLVQIDPRDYQAARDQADGALEVAQAQLANAQEAYSKAQVQYPATLQAAQAQLASAEANLTNAQANNRRQQSIARPATTQQNIDQASAGLREAEAQVAQARANLLPAQLIQQNIAQAAAQVKQWQGQVEQAKADLDRANLNLSYTRVLAPQDGWITERRVDQGDYVQVGGALLSIVSPVVWITANFKETQLARMQPGDRVTISVDAYPNLKLTGHVDSVQQGSGSRFTAFPAENATGNFVKIVQRVPVKIDIDSGLDPHKGLPLGISIEPTVYFK
jgi:membrane fusion protein (multidrug efflux system)